MKKLFFILLLVGFNVTAADLMPKLPVEEHLLGVSLEESGIRFQVHSHGCTQKSDFTLKVVPTETSAPYQLTLIRNNPDHCAGFLRDGVSIYFQFSELNLPSGIHFEIMNPIMGFVR